MSMQGNARTGSHSSTGAFVQWTTGLMETVPYWLLALFARIPVAAVFWNSGRTKVDGWNIFQINDSSRLLFETEFQLPLLDPLLAAHLAALAEHVFPVLLAVGLATRYAALALLAMTAVIQVFVYPDAWPTHGTWAACLLLVAARGPGAVSADHWVRYYFRAVQ